MNFFTKRFKRKKHNNLLDSLQILKLPLVRASHPVESFENKLEVNLYTAKAGDYANSPLGELFLYFADADSKSIKTKGRPQWLHMEVTATRHNSEEEKNVYHPSVNYTTRSFSGFRQGPWVVGILYELTTKFGTIFFSVNEKDECVDVFVKDLVVITLYLSEGIGDMPEYTFEKGGRRGCFRYSLDGKLTVISGSARDATTYFDPRRIAGGLETSLRQFIGAGSVFDRIGVPHKTGVILYGPPGTGKTVLTQILAAQLEIPYIQLPLAGMDCAVFDRVIGDLQSRQGYMVCIDDIDVCGVIMNRLEDDPSKIQLSQLLSLLDGQASSSNIIIMTTNHIEKMDPALLRAGRFDFKVELNGYTLQEAIGFWKFLGEKFQADLTPEMFVEVFKEKEVYYPADIEAEAKKLAFAQLFKF